MTDVRILTDPLGGSPLSRALQQGTAPAAWLPARPRGAEAWRARATERLASGDWREALTALAPAFAATGEAARQLARVVEQGGVVVTTGQQPGLFGGPVYTWSKAMSALALAAALERETGIPTVAVYWAATDDADFAEASSTVVARAGGAQLLRATDAPPAGTPMSRAPLGDLAAQRHALAAACGSAPDPRALSAAIDAYGDAGGTVGGAFVALLRALLQPLGMPVLDASHAAVHAASAAMLNRAQRDAAVVEAALLARDAELRAAGYVPQVEHMAGLSLAFVNEEGIKRRLAVSEPLAATGIVTPNVLLRPIVEQAILPTVAYVAGPGELAYFAQVSAAAAALGTPAPLAVPRWSCTLVEPHVDALLTAFGVGIEELATPHALEARVAREAMSGETAAALRTVRASVATLPAALAGEAAPLGLDRAVLGATHALEHRLERLERRLLAGIKRREETRMRDVGTLRGALHPFGHRQERALNLIPLLARHGTALLGEMRNAAGAHAEDLLGVGRR